MEVGMHETDDGEKYVALEVMAEGDRVGEPNEAASRTFEGWVAEDYHEFLRNVQRVQIMQFERLADFFEEPEKFKVSTGETVADWLTTRES
jgi:hypothetical protein